MRSSLLSLFVLAAFINNISASGTKTITVKMSELSTGANHSTQIYFASGTCEAFVSPEDSRESFNGTQSAVYSITSDGIPCNSAGFGALATSSVIGIGCRAQQGGFFVLSISKGSDFDNGTIIILEDRLLGTFTNLSQHSDTVQLAQAGQHVLRFYLHISPAPILNTIAAGCNNSNGVINVNEDASVKWSTVLLFDSNNIAIQSIHDTSGAFGFANLTGGNYLVAFSTVSGYSFVNKVEVASHQVLLSITSSAATTAIGQTVQFFSTTSNASQYVWEFGDSSIITGIANPSYDYYENGNYTVTLRASNSFECSATAVMAMSVENQMSTSIINLASEGFKVYCDNKNVVINNTNPAEVTGTCEVYNLAGQLLLTAPLASTQQVVNMENQSAGIYLVNIKTSNGNFTTKLFTGKI